MPALIIHGDFGDAIPDWRTLVAALAFTIVVSGWEVLARAVLLEVALVIGIIVICRFTHRPPGPCTNDALPPV
jgi:hypothetical protein